MQPKLGILAGGGRLPADIIDICQRTGRPFYVIAFDEQVEQGLCDGVPHSCIRLGAGGQTLKTLRDNHVEEILLVGSIKRPSLAQLRPDMWGIRFLARTGAMALGDDGILTLLVRTLEENEGFRVIGIEDIAQEFLAPSGAIGSVIPSADNQEDIRLAVSAAMDLGRKDIGQAAVARNGRIVGLEDASGTDSLLDRLSTQIKQERPDDLQGVLAKIAKPQQERRADLPTIGVTTVENAARVGLAGIVVEADGAIVLERKKVAEKADQLGLFVLGIHPEAILAHD